MSDVNTQVKTVPQKLIGYGVKAAGVSVGFAAGSVLVNTINAATPQQTIQLGNVSFGIGDAVLAIGGGIAAGSLLKGKIGGELAKTFVDSAIVGALGGWAVNKAAAAVGRQPIFNNPFPELGGAPAARTRALYGGTGSSGYLVPSSAFAARSAAPVLPIRSAYAFQVS